MPLSLFVSFKARHTQYPKITAAGRGELGILGYVLWYHNTVVEEVFIFLYPSLKAH